MVVRAASCDGGNAPVKKKGKHAAARQAALKQGVVAKAARPFAMFVKCNYRVAKGQPPKQHQDEMRRLSQAWRSLGDKGKEAFRLRCTNEW